MPRKRTGCARSGTWSERGGDGTTARRRLSPGSEAEPETDSDADADACTPSDPLL